MKLNYHSIKLQIFLAFSALALPVMVLAYFFSLFYHHFDQSLQQLIQIEDVANTMGAIERDVIDLQRNTLIFKETASDSAEGKVTFYYENIQEKIRNVSHQLNLAEYSEAIQRMNGHLDDYYENFQTVVSLRRERSVLIRDHLKFAAELHRMFVDDPQSVDLYNALLVAHADSIAYLSAYDVVHYERFKQQLAHAHILAQAVTDKANINKEIEVRQHWQHAISEYEKRFFKIVSVTRHYIYLINVVIAGSANEIIYYANHLHLKFVEMANLSRHEVTGQLQRQKVWIGSVSVVVVLLALIAALQFYQRITLPIERITNVFNRLVAGEPVGDIPETHRRDEIGSLATAADVFRAKNAQTHQLLVESKKMVLEQRKLNDELIVAKRNAEKALSIKSDFLANMSHELRTPLNSVIGYTVRLLKHARADKEVDISALKTIERNGKHLLNMINDILDLSKIEAQKMDLSLSNVDLNALCEQCITQVEPEAEEKNLEIVFIRAKVAMVESDFTRVSQILLNLLSNAIKYTQKGGIKLELEQDFSGKYVNIRVIDSGIGIQPENQKKLFNRFEQFDDSSRFRIGHGTGLGLAIVANLSKLLGIWVSVSSDVDQGSTFSLRIPVKFQGNLSRPT